MSRSKSVPSPSFDSAMISRFTSNTDRLVPSKVICTGSFCDLNLKKMEEDMVSSGDSVFHRIHKVPEMSSRGCSSLFEFGDGVR